MYRRHIEGPEAMRPSGITKAEPSAPTKSKVLISNRRIQWVFAISTFNSPQIMHNKFVFPQTLIQSAVDSYMHAFIGVCLSVTYSAITTILYDQISAAFWVGHYNNKNVQSS